MTNNKYIAFLMIVNVGEWLVRCLYGFSHSTL